MHRAPVAVAKISERWTVGHTICACQQAWRAVRHVLRARWARVAHSRREILCRARVRYFVRGGRPGGCASYATATRAPAQTPTREIDDAGSAGTVAGAGARFCEEGGENFLKMVVAENQGKSGQCLCVQNVSLALGSKSPRHLQENVLTSRMMIRMKM